MTAAAIRQVTTPKKVALLVAAFILFNTARALADDPQPLPGPHVTVTSGDGVVEVPSGKYILPVGSHILDGTTYQNLDNEVKRLQEVATRYKAESDSLKKSINTWQPGWGTLIVLTGLAISAGVVMHYTN